MGLHLWGCFDSVRDCSLEGVLQTPVEQLAAQQREAVASGGVTERSGLYGGIAALITRMGP